MITSVYARCNALERLELWEDISWVAEDINIPWLVGGDFNVIFNDTEKPRGLPVNQMETTNFSQCVSDAGLTELPFLGSQFT